MIRHAARALPWPLLVATAILLVGLLRVVEQWPFTMWPLQGLAVGLLAGAVAFACDEPAAAVVDTLPRGLAWQGLAATVAVVAAVTALRRHGRASPAGAIGAGVVAAAAYAALARPFERELPLFPHITIDTWELSRDLWTAVLVGGLSWLVVTLRS